MKKKVLLSLMALCLVLPALAQEVEWGQKRIPVNVEDGIKPLTSVGGYDLYYYAYGLTTNNTVFTQNFSFAVTCYIGNFSGTDIESCYFRVGLTDKDGDLKEWISTEDLNTGIKSLYAEEIRSTCIITTEDLVVGDRIYLYAQIGATEENGWVKIDEYYGSDAIPTYIEITEVGDPVYTWNVMLVYDGLTTNVSEYYTGMSFTTTIEPVNFSNTMIDKCYFKIGLTDSEGNLVEWLSNELSYSNFEINTVLQLSPSCTITSDLQSGYRIRAFYQPNEDSEDGWIWIEPYDTENGEIVLTENMILDKLYDSVSGLFYNILNEAEVEVTCEKEGEESIPYTQEEVTIPASVSTAETTYTVIGVGYQAFNGCTNLTSVAFPSSVTYIGEQAFSNCSSLSEIELLESLTEIGDYAFSGCSALTGELTIPNSVVTIGASAFNSCSGLTSVVIGSGVTTIGASAFQYCEKLSSVTFGENVETIGGTAFASTILEGELVIPDKVTSIGEWAFSGCDKLTSLTLGSSLMTIGGSAFNSCDGLTVVTSLNTTPPTCGDNVFESVETSVIPLYVPLGCSSEYLADETWSEFNVMEIVNVGDKIYDSTSGLYYNILSDTEVEVTWGGEYDWSGTTEYTGEITIPETVTYGVLTYNVTRIGDAAFVYSNITSISIPSWVTSLGDGIVTGCQSLKTIEVAEDNPNYCVVDNVLFSKDKTTLLQYPAGVEATSYDIPQGVTTIGFEAFCFNYNLTSVTFPNSVTTIGEEAFDYCINLASIDIPDNVITIEDYAFFFCDAAKTITIGNGVISIGDCGFDTCRNIETVTIGSSVETIGDYAFRNAGYNLSENNKVKLSILNPTPPKLGTYVFYPSNVTVYVPAGTLAEYNRVWGTPDGVSSMNELDYAVLKITLSDDGANGYATYYDDDYDIDISDTGIKAYWAENVDEGTVTLTNIGATIPAKTAVVLTGALTDITEAPATASSVESTYTTNLLHGHSTTGMLEAEDGDYLYYMLTTNTSGTNVGFYYGATGGAAFSSKANKAWLAVPEGQANSLSIKFKDEIDDTTGISSVGANYGEGDGNIYTIQGIHVNDMSRPGVYIVNGKKILVK